MALQSGKNTSSSGGEKPHRELLSQFKNNFEQNHPSFFHELSIKYRLTGQELLICAMIRSGKKSKEIADLLNIALATVGTHRTNIRNKIKLKNLGLANF